jgi:hypothetical protein
MGDDRNWHEFDKELWYDEPGNLNEDAHWGIVRLSVRTSRLENLAKAPRDSEESH